MRNFSDKASGLLSVRWVDFYSCKHEVWDSSARPDSWFMWVYWAATKQQIL